MSEEEEVLPNGEAIAHLVAERIHGSVNKGAVNKYELAQNIGEIEIETQINGASFLKLHVIDPEWTIAKQGWLDLNEEGIFKEEVQLEFPEKSRWHWSICAVEISTDVTEPNLVITFEDRVVSYMRGYWGEKLVPPGTQTRAQFIRDLVQEVGSKGEERIKFVCPSLNILQEVETEEESESKKTKTTQAEEQRHEEINKMGGVSVASNVTIGGAKPNAEQLRAVNIALRTAKKHSAPFAAYEALIAAGISESNFEPEASENDDPSNPHKGVWQSDVIPGGIAYVEKQAEYFLKGGESFQAGGAIKLANEKVPPAEIAYRVEAGGSVKRFEEALPEARKLIKAGGGIQINTSEENKSDVGQLQRGTSSNPDEDNWECCVRLAQQVDWYFYSNMDYVYYMEKSDFEKQFPSLYVDIPRNHVRRRTERSTEGEYGVILQPTTFQFDQCLALDTPLPTPSGWTTMGDVQVGDTLFGSQGQPVTVVRALRVATDRECFRVRFSDGESIVADAGHLWDSYTVRPNQEKAIDGDKRHGIYTTKEIAESLYGYDKPPNPARLNHRIDVAKSLELPKADLPIDPYIFGYWLGDGTHSSMRLTVGPEDLESILAQIEKAGYSYKATEYKSSSLGRPWWHIAVADTPEWCKAKPRKGLPQALRDLGVWGNKHIPNVYLRASVAQRTALLQGLMDSDGTIHRHCEITQIKADLMSNIVELIHSLGLQSHTRIKPPRVNDRPQYGVIFSPQEHVQPFRIPRKVERYNTLVAQLKNASKARRRGIVAVEPIDSVPVRCIEVDTKDHLFLAGSAMVPTRNTTFEYRQTHKVKTRVQRKSKQVKPSSPSEIKLQLQCSVTAFKAGQVFVFQNSGPANGTWVITDTKRNCLKDTFTEILLEPPVEPLPEPKETEEDGAITSNESETFSSAVTAAKKALSEKPKYEYSESSNRENKGTLFGPSPRTMDCSSFCILCYKAANLPDPAGMNYKPIGNTDSVIKNCVKVGDPQPGDFCFWGPSESQTIHMTLYVGGGKAIAMQAPGITLGEGEAKTFGPGNFLGYYRPTT